MHEKGIEKMFVTAPIEAFYDARIRQTATQWRDSFSEGTGDNMMDTLKRIVSFGHQRGHLGYNHLQNIHKRVRSNRAHVIWLPEEIEAFVQGTPRYVSNILVAAVETGMRPGDLQVLERRNIEDIGNGRKRLLIRTRKSNRRTFASVPVTRRFAELLAEVPENRQRILVGEDGEPFQDSGALGALISKWRDRLGLRSELRLYDARGTAVTRLVRAGCTLSELAAHMGWSLAHASQMLERYARLDPDMSDDILEKIEEAERRRALRQSV